MKNFMYLLLILFSASIYSQGMRFEDAKAKGIYPGVEQRYKSAIASDASNAVFSSDEDVDKLINSYSSFMQDLGAYLESKGFYWDVNTRCFNRIYINKGGNIDYFLYQFKTPLSAEKEAEFKKLLNAYIKESKLGITASENFSQCSPVVYPATRQKTN